MSIKVTQESIEKKRLKHQEEQRHELLTRAYKKINQIYDRQATPQQALAVLDRYLVSLRELRAELPRQFSFEESYESVSRVNFEIRRVVKEITRLRMEIIKPNQTQKR